MKKQYSMFYSRKQHEVPNMLAFSKLYSTFKGTVAWNKQKDHLTMLSL